jgi:hypothetical protein
MTTLSISKPTPIGKQNANSLGGIPIDLNNASIQNDNILYYEQAGNQWKIGSTVEQEINSNNIICGTQTEAGSVTIGVSTGTGVPNTLSLVGPEVSLKVGDATTTQGNCNLTIGYPTSFTNNNFGALSVIGTHISQSSLIGWPKTTVDIPLTVTAVSGLQTGNTVSVDPVCWTKNWATFSITIGVGGTTIPASTPVEIQLVWDGTMVPEGVVGYCPTLKLSPSTGGAGGNIQNQIGCMQGGMRMFVDSANSYSGTGDITLTGNIMPTELWNNLGNGQVGFVLEMNWLKVES